MCAYAHGGQRSKLDIFLNWSLLNFLSFSFSFSFPSLLSFPFEIGFLYYVALAILEFTMYKDPAASASPVLGLKAHTSYLVSSFFSFQDVFIYVFVSATCAVPKETRKGF